METWLNEMLIPQANEAFKNSKFIIHGDIQKNTLMAYPTHTHGLIQYGLPEILMNASAFGPEGNAHMINLVSVGMMLNKEYLKRFEKIGFLEMKTGVFVDNEDPILCLRMIPLTFLGVTKAYQPIEMSIVGHAQLYVKGDDHVLKDEYFEGIPSYE